MFKVQIWYKELTFCFWYKLNEILSILYKVQIWYKKFTFWFWYKFDKVCNNKVQSEKWFKVQKLQMIIPNLSEHIEFFVIFEQIMNALYMLISFTYYILVRCNYLFKIIVKIITLKYNNHKKTLYKNISISKCILYFCLKGVNQRNDFAFRINLACIINSPHSIMTLQGTICIVLK